MTTAEVRAVCTALRCPFIACQGRGARPIEVSSEQGVGHGYPMHQVECFECGARGPTRLTRESAVKAWNATTELTSRKR